MWIESTGIKEGIIDEKYGKYGAHFIKDMPSYSLPFEIIEAPEKTVSFAVILDDVDAIPVCGFVWVHWLIANLKKPELKENVSGKINPEFIQGNNSWNMPLYGGMAPPDKDHIYDLKVYALDCELDLEEGFSLEELENKMQGHVLAKAILKGLYHS